MNLLNQKSPNKKIKKVLTLENAKRLLKGKQNVLTGFERKIFPTGNRRKEKESKY